MRPYFSDRLARRHQARLEADAVRVLRTVDARDGVRIRRDGLEFVAFCGNDYLGLADHPEVIAALRAAADQHGVGATAAHLVCGHHRLHAQLEDEVADWLGQPRALLFGSGYLANLGVLQALLEPGDLCLQDRLNHACLLDGARLSGATLKRYPHADAEAAARRLRANPAALALLVTDGVFSMDGDLAPLPELAALARAERTVLYVDDAHAVGVLGAHGRGSAAARGLEPAQVPLTLVTLGKALGGYGALVVGGDALIEEILQSARSYLFATALPPALAAAALAAVRIARRDDARRAHLHALIARFRAGAAQLGLPLMPSPSAIQPLVLGANARALDAAAALEARGLLVPAIRPPTVPAGKARLRVTLSAAHTEADVDRLLDALALVLPTPA